MSPDNMTAAVRPHDVPADSVFTVERANAALMLVRRIVRDLVGRYHDLLEYKRQRKQLVRASASFEQHEAIKARLTRCVADLGRLHQELSEIGCVLKDWGVGLVDFPARYEGRRVWLCWKLGEPAVAHWHEWHEGFAGRKPITPEFGCERRVG